MGEAVTFADTGTFSLSLNDGGTDLFDMAASDATHLVLTHTVQPDQIAADLTITAVNLNGASILDAAGNAAALAGAVTNPSGLLRIDGYTGSAGADTFRGTGGAETFRGLAGDDTYLVNNAGDAVVEASNAGTDTVQTALASDTLGTNVENLTYVGAGAFAGTGNNAANILTGNTGANRLGGGTGADTLRGGLGDDVYVTDGGDTITETADAGTDTVQSSATLTLSANLENLTLTGTATVNGTGNTLDNVLTGNGAANTLAGGAGADRLVGGAGADQLTGGAGADRFVFLALSDSAPVGQGDLITDFSHSGGDVIDLFGVDASAGVAGDQAFTFIGSGAFTGQAGQLHQVRSGTMTLVEGDVDGNGTADF